MIRLIKNSIFIFLLFAACHPSKEEALPFYNDPEFTPRWIEPSSSAYDSIHTIPAFSFINQEGDTVTEKMVEGKIYVANFMFTSCVSICPVMTENMKILQKEFERDEEVVLLSHSVLPSVDSVSVLNKYAERKGIISSKWHLLTGDRDAIYSLAKKQYYAGDSIGFYGSQRDFLHTESFILVDKHRRIRGVYNGTIKFEMDRIIEDIRTLMKEK
jgi:protein SCO1/2